MKSILKFITIGGLYIIPFLTLFVANSYFFPYITGKNFAFRIIVEIIFTSWVILSLIDVKYRPKKSWLLIAFLSFLGIMFLADWQGVSRVSSFFSNFERMDGYITLVHVFLYVLVLGSVLQTKRDWSIYLNTTLAVAVLVFIDNAGDLKRALISGEGVRVEGSLGNAAYLAIYLLFHIFIALWLLVESKSKLLWMVYGTVAVALSSMLIGTGTRGTVIGLGAGLGSMVTYIALFGYKVPKLRKVSLGIIIFMVVLVGGFFSIKDSDLVQNNYNLARIANLDLGKDLKVRSTIWGLAWEGVKEKPVLGWGQSNFNFVFNKYYEPFLYDQEQWFDRSHNIIFDWLIAGGFLGLISYLSIFLASFYYLIVKPIKNKNKKEETGDEEGFSILESAVLVGILVGYFVHNLVVFDNLISYIFFAVILALIHSRVAKPIEAIEKIKVDKDIVNQFALPVGIIFVGFLIYSIHAPAMSAAKDVIYASSAGKDLKLKLNYFTTALDRDSFAQQEITEQMVQKAIEGVAQNAEVPEDVRQEFFSKTEEAMNNLIAAKPNDARLHIFFSGFYRAFNDLEKAKEQALLARELSPKKQYIILQQGIIVFLEGNYVGAKDFFKEAWELDERNNEAFNFYFASLFYAGDVAEAKTLLTEDGVLQKVSKNDFVLSSVRQAGELDMLTELYEARLENEVTADQDWITLSAIYLEKGEKAKSIEILKRSIDKKPNLSKIANCFIGNIEADKEPGLGCKN